MLTWFNVKKKQHYFSNTVGPLCPASLKRFVFYKVLPSSLLWLANWPSALWLAEHHKQHRKCNARFHNRELQLSKLKYQLMVITSLRGEQSRVADTVMKLVCVCKQAAKTLEICASSLITLQPKTGCPLKLSRVELVSTWMGDLLGKLGCCWKRC